MRTESKRALLAAAFGLALAIGLFRTATGCGSDTDGGRKPDGSADVSGDSKVDVLDATLDADSADDAPTTDGGWTSMGWPKECNLHWQNPISAQKQAWSDCGLPGCAILKLTYPYEDFQPIAVSQVASVEGSTRALFIYRKQKSPKFETGYLTLDSEGQPVQYLKSVECAPFVSLGPSGICALSAGVGGGGAVGALFANATPPIPPIDTFDTKGSFEVVCTKELFASHDDVGTPTVRDLNAAAEYLITPPNGTAFDVRLHGEYALFMRDGVEGGNAVFDGWLWKRPNQLVKLVDPGAQKVFDIRTDGTTLVWTQVNAADPKDIASGDLWTSSFATTAIGLAPQKRRSVPPSTAYRGNYSIGGGYYALVEGSLSNTKTKLHVYRLSDARHWEVPPPPGLVNSTVLYIDGKEVWYLARLPNGLNQTVARQKLDALGPGD